MEESDGMYTPWQRIHLQKSRRASWFLFETVMYGLFMLVFCMVTYNFRSSWAYNMSELVRSSLLEPKYDDGYGKNYYTMRTTEEFYRWTNDVFFPSLYFEEWYSGHAPTPYERGFLRWNNLVVGRVRFRQLRVQRNVGCTIPSAFEHLIEDCYPPYLTSYEDTTPYGPGGKYVFKTAEELCGSNTLAKYCKAWVLGTRSDNRYSSNGYVWDFPHNLTQARKELESLRVTEWIDPATRAVIIDFTMFNPNVNLVVATQLNVEFYATGTITTLASIKPLPLMTIEQTTQVAELVGEILLVVWIGVYVIREAVEFFRFWRLRPERCTECVRNKIIKHGTEKVAICFECDREFNPFQNDVCPQCLREIADTHMCWRGYFQDPWNTLDIINQALFAFVFAVRFQLRSDMADYNYDVGDGFLLLYPLAWRFTMANYLNSFNALLCFIKIFKYLGRFKSLSALVKTLGAAKAELSYFVLIFFVIFMGFAMSFHMAFGDDIRSYRHWLDSALALWMMLLGEFDYLALQESNRALAPIFFFGFIVLVFFVLANMFIAIVSGSYEEATTSTRDGKDDYMSSSLKLFFRDLRKLPVLKTIFGHNNNLPKVQALLTELEGQDLEESKKDDIRTLRREIDHDPDNSGLLARIVAAFPTGEAKDDGDYDTLKRAVVAYKKVKMLEKFKDNAFEEDEYDRLQGLLGMEDGAESNPSAVLPYASSVDLGRRASTYLGASTTSFRASSTDATDLGRHRPAQTILKDIEGRQQSVDSMLRKIADSLEKRGKEVVYR